MFKIYLVTFINTTAESKIKSFPLTDVSKPIWYPERSDSKVN